MRPDYKTTHLAGITDLTVLARIKDGFVEGPFETETHVERLRRVLAVLNTFRQASREASLQPSPFPDSIGQFQAIHFFRFAIVPPDSARPPHLGPHRLLLNVTFDGGWEPYMRVIWGPLGTLLDLIFCHCDGYPLASESSFDKYMRWVRKNEVQTSFFYADAATTVADQRFLARLEALQRENGAQAHADASAASLALPGQPAPVIPNAYAVDTALRALKALAGLRPLFVAAADDQILQRFVSDSLRELRDWIAQSLFDPGQRYEHLRASFEEERPWLMTPRLPPAGKAAGPSFDWAAVQAGIAEPFDLQPTVIHGALVLLRVNEVNEALRWLKDAPVTKATDKVGAGVAKTLALTYAGLVHLGVPKSCLERLPREFVEGMEMRAGILGDLRGNHPQWWRRPQLNWPLDTPPALPVELSSVHVLVQLRTAAAKGDEEGDGRKPIQRLVDEINALQKPGSGLTVLSVQAMKSRAPSSDMQPALDNFSFVDGISQPRLTAANQPPAYWDDKVKFGELFLGYANDRGDDPTVKDPDEPDEGPVEAAEKLLCKLLLDNGSFLVVRKLRQHVDRLARLVDEAAKRLAPDSPTEQKRLAELFRCKLLGRRSDGKPMVGIVGQGDNDFDYRSDGDGAACPFWSHIRRANPREARPRQPPPRIARRGMSYGNLDTEGDPGAERGLVFMAYNASIAEQFEVIQRWLAGANSSGVSSAESDPFVGVPEAGRRRVYRFVHDGQVLRLDLGDQPLAQLEWGVYAFVPSIAALKALPDIVKKPKDGPTATPEPSLPKDSDAWKQLLEDGRSREAAWADVRARGGVIDTEYGVLVGSPEAVLEVLQDDGSRFSVSGYGKRMEQSIGGGGRGYLGQDNKAPNAGHERPYVEKVNEAIERTISESKAYEAAREIAVKWLQDRLAEQAHVPVGKRQAQIDLTRFAGAVITALCARWFGLPDGKFVLGGPRSDKAHTDKPLCPGHLVAVSRYVFSPYPSKVVEKLAQPQGQDYAEAVKAFLKAGVPANAALTKAIVDAMQGEAADLQARTVAGVMLGFPPTVLGNLVTVLMRWTASRGLWDRQQELIALRAKHPELGHAYVQPALLETLLETMRQSPVPYMDWRTAAADTELSGCSVKRGKLVIVGLGSAVRISKENEMLMFGGKRGETIHACPGYGLAVGVMLGCITPLLTQGALRPTLDPRALLLIG
jgi:hypothetical protein